VQESLHRAPESLRPFLLVLWPRLCLVLLSLSPSISITVDELHSESLYINVPLSVTQLSSLVPSILTIDTYNGMGWLTIEAFHLDRLRLSTPLGWFDTHTGGWIIKTKVSVSYKGESFGQLILDMDFEPNFVGTLQYLGCAATQSFPCHQATQMNRSTTYPKVEQTLVSDGITLLANFSISSTNTTQEDFVEWIMSHYLNKYEGKPGSDVTLSVDSGNFPSTPVISLDVDYFVTDMLLNRYGLVVDRFCGVGECFIGPNNYLVDNGGNIIT